MQLHVPLIVLCSLFLFHDQVLAQTDPPRAGVKRGRITLPPRQVEKPKNLRTAAHRNDPDQFYRDVIDLRSSKVLTAKHEEQLLRSLQDNHDDPAGMAIKLSLRCRNDLLHGLMKVVDRYGTKYHAEELHFQVLSRPLGRVTTRVVKAVITKSGERAKGRLFDYLVCKYAPARKTAVDLLPEYLTSEDIPRLIQLSRHKKSDIRRKVVSLLGGIADPRIYKRLMEILSQDPFVAPNACLAAIAQGEPMVELLGGVLRRPARGKGFGYACLALFHLESQLGRELFTRDMVASMVRELRGDDQFLCVSSAIALGAIAHRTEDWIEKDRHDKKVVDNLLLVVAPDKFITSMRMLKPAAAEVLVKFTGHDFQGRNEGWRGWWSVARRNFVGLRRTLALTPENVGGAMLIWAAAEHFLVFRGPEVPDHQVPKGSRAVFLDGGQLLALVRDLQDFGFMSATGLPTTPKVWTIDMRVGGSRILMRLAPSRDGRGRSAKVHRTFVKVAQAQLWQRYRDPKTHPDAVAFWQAERKWLAANPDKTKPRLVAAIIGRLTVLDATGRKDALDDLQSIEGLPNLIDEVHGSKLVEVARAQKELDVSDFRLLELAVMTSGETTWRQALGVLDGQISVPGNKRAGQELADRLFRLLGPERALLSIKHPSKKIAMAAMHDAAATKHRAAEPILLTRMRDKDTDVQRTAIYALGVLRSVPALKPLLAYEKTANPVIRREIWAALGRIGGTEVVGVLKRAMESPANADKLALISAMGHTKSGELARFLASRYASQGNKPNDLTQMAEMSLRAMGPLLAGPALRQHLQMEAGPARHQLVMLLAEQQDPMVVPDLIDYLRHPLFEREAAQRLSEITGYDLLSVNNRNQAMRVWHTYNKSRTQGHWYLSALTLLQIPTSLKPGQLGPRIGVEPVPELVRLLLKLKAPHMRIMTATLLRETTGVDFTRKVRLAEGAALQAIADRYRFHADTVRAAGK